MRTDVMVKPEQKFVEIDLSGKLNSGAYKDLVPKLEQWIEENGKLRLLVNMHNFHGWNLGGLWEDIKFDVRHFADFERVAFVGETKWQEYMSAFCKPFTTAKVRYFQPFEITEAKTWLES